MPTDRQLEVYRQLSESFRFQYRQEWQLLQVGAVTGLVILGVGEKNLVPVWWRFLISGMVFLGFSYSMYRMAKGNKENRPIWMSYARVVGDPTVNELGPPWTSAAVCGRWILCVFGVAGVCLGVWRSDFFPEWMQLIVSGLTVLALRLTCIDCEGYQRKRSNIVFAAGLMDAIFIGSAVILILLGTLKMIESLYVILSFLGS